LEALDSRFLEGDSMTTLSINSANSYYQYAQTANQRQTDFQNLGNALQSGNLAGAQNAFAALQQNLPNNSSQQAGAQSNPSNPVATDFQNLANALSSNNLTSAQQAYAQLQQDLKSLQGHHHHHHHGGDSGSSESQGTSQTSPSGNAGSSSSTNGQAIDVQA
jgi:hypothetical protein